MKRFTDWSIRYKLLALGVATFAATGTIASLKYLQALKQNAANQLAGVRRSKAFQIESYYRTIKSHALPEMQKLHLARPRFEYYLPFTSAGIQLQYAYIVKNPFPPGQRLQMMSGGSSNYDRVHAKYHEAFRNIVQRFGYYDLFLIDHDTEQIVTT